MKTFRQRHHCRKSQAYRLEFLEPRILLCDEINWDLPDVDWVGDCPTQPAETQPAETQPADTQPAEPPSDYYVPPDTSCSDTSNDQTDYLWPCSDTGTFEIPLPPAIASHLKTRVADTTVKLTWYEPAGDADGFWIQRRGPTGGWKTVAQVPTDARFYVDPGLAPGTKYTYRVEAFNSDGSSTSKTVSATTPGVHLDVTSRPTTVAAGTRFSISVALQNANHHIDPSAQSPVTLSIFFGPAGSTLAGTLTVNAQDGVAVFSDLFLTAAGKYRLIATDGISTVKSGTLTVTPDDASAHLVLTATASSKVGRTTKPAISLTIQDAFGNRVTRGQSQVSIALVDGPAGGQLGGKLAITTKNGKANFNGLTFSEPGHYTLAATDPSLAMPATVQVAIDVAPANVTIPASPVRKSSLGRLCATLLTPPLPALVAPALRHSMP